MEQVTSKEVDTYSEGRLYQMMNFCSVKEAAQMLGVGLSFIYERVRCGAIKSVRFGRVIRIPVDEIERMCKEGVA